MNNSNKHAHFFSNFPLNCFHHFPKPFILMRRFQFLFPKAILLKSTNLLTELQIKNGSNEKQKIRRVERSPMHWNGIEEDEDIAYLEGFIENVSYEDVFRSHRDLELRNGSFSTYSNTKNSKSDDDEVWAILVTPKPITVKAANSLSKNNNKTKKRQKTIHDYDKRIRQQKRKISDLAVNAIVTDIKKKPTTPIVVNKTEFGENN